MDQTRPKTPRAKQEASPEEGGWRRNLSIWAAFFLCFSGFGSFKYGPARTTSQFVFRISLLAIGVVLLGIHGVRKSGLSPRLKTGVSVGLFLLGGASVAYFGLRYSTNNGPLDTSLYAKAVVRDGMYLNEAIGLAVPIAPGWHVTTSDLLSENPQLSERMQKSANPEVRDVATTGQARIILSVTKFPYDPNSTSINPSLMVQLARCNGMTGDKYLAENEEFSKRNGMPMERVGQISRRQLGNENVYCGKYTMAGLPNLRWEILVTMREGYAIMFQSIQENPDDQATIEGMLAGIKM